MQGPVSLERAKVLDSLKKKPVEYLKFESSKILQKKKNISLIGYVFNVLKKEKK